ncbi:MAG: ion channel [Pseudomonadota bacterium]
MVYVFLVNSVVVALAVAIHYEFLHLITRILPRVDIKHRLRIVFAVFAALCAHAVEVWIFALSYYLMHHAENWGELRGNFDGSLLDAAYFSFTTYTTLGFGDVEPIGDLRFLTGLESLTGLVLITWTASFLYLEMSRYWETH